MHGCKGNASSKLCEIVYTYAFIYTYTWIDTGDDDNRKRTQKGQHACTSMTKQGTSIRKIVWESSLVSS